MDEDTLNKIADKTLTDEDISNRISLSSLDFKEKFDHQ